MLTNLFKSFIAVLLFAAAEAVIVAVFPTANNLTYGIIALLLGLCFVFFAFAHYVDKQNKVNEAVNDLTQIISLDDLKRLAPIADNPDMIQDFLQRFGINYEANLSKYEQQLASLQTTNNDLHSRLKQVVSDYEKANSDIVASARQMQSDLSTQKSDLERKVSDLQLQLNNWKTKYEVLESGTDEQKAEHLRNLYFSAKNRLNAKNNGKS